VIRAAACIALAAALAGAVAWGLRAAYSAGAESVRTEWAQADAAAAAAAQALAVKRTEAIERIDHAATIQTRRVATDRVAAAVAGSGLRFRAEAVAAGCPAEPASPGETTTDPGYLLSNVLGRLEAAGRELAATADERGTAGAACEASFDTMKGPP
jgi:acyl-coenzyme A synthetase/AMP-(fatty) acid ligase